MRLLLFRLLVARPHKPCPREDIEDSSFLLAASFRGSHFLEDFFEEFDDTLHDTQESRTYAVSAEFAVSYRASFAAEE